ncbi:phosphate:AMP phosphotransferase [Atopococcus tabaci]|uniref:phosphate:AMP phosphotransferase n=1 Tax=Atopococcus tabaci TaxID=269774 RepID=UPI002409B63F|nr:phosphate:AMP phosphotransferase [Atopococcus tabaci]
MLKEYDFSKFENPYSDFKRKELGERLARAQRLVQNLDIPVLIIVDGWESSGKGYVIKDLVRELNPKTYKVSVFERPTEEEEARPFLWRFWEKTPQKGSMAIFDRSFYFKLLNDPTIQDDELEKNIQDISSIEKQLLDDNAIIIKFFLHQTEKTQQKRIDELQKDEYRSFMISERDEDQYKNYDTYLKHFDEILKKSDFTFSKWHILSTEDLKAASEKALGTTIDLIHEGIDRIMGMKNGGVQRFYRETIPSEKPLQDVDLNLHLSDKEYEKQKDELQLEAQRLAFKLYTSGIPTVLVFEGVDAAGKGGAIERLTRQMDPRGYEVITTSAPSDYEAQHHYLWRFYRNFPKKGDIKIFDRSWYGRVMVERVEQFATVEEWERAYEEINQMEQHLHNFGTLVLKFFLYIDKDEQLERFKDRQEEADKIYKITEEDWRNREKWDDYIEAMDEMLVRTDTSEAPWVIVEAQDKKYARIKVLKEFIYHAKKALKQV